VFSGVVRVNGASADQILSVKAGAGGNVVSIFTSDYAVNTTGSVLLLGFLSSTGNTTARLYNGINGGASAGGIQLGAGATDPITIPGTLAVTGTLAAGATTVTGTLSATTGAAVGGATAGAGGLAFPATAVAVADANTLDDYEEGTWTPTIVRESTALGAVTYTAQDGKYTKIGRVVYITCSVAWSNIASAGAGANRIDGLPFSSGVSQTNGGATFYSSDGIATNPVLAGLFYNSTIYLRKSANILAVSNLNEAYNNSGTFAFNGYYFV
jgi:hypothetical protein